MVVHLADHELRYWLERDIAVGKHANPVYQAVSSAFGMWESSMDITVVSRETGCSWHSADAIEHQAFERATTNLEREGKRVPLTVQDEVACWSSNPVEGCGHFRHMGQLHVALDNRPRIHEYTSRRAAPTGSTALAVLSI